MELSAVSSSYARWAPIYDKTFGVLTSQGRRRVVDYINGRGGKVLEVGVGTGLSLPSYMDTVEVTGIDYSPEMLEKAVKKNEGKNLNPIK